MKRILVAYATKSGTTKRAAEGLARALAPECDLYDLRRETLLSLGGTASRLPLRALRFSDYRTVAIGSAMYIGKPLKPFLRVLQSRAEELMRQPLFLFTCGIASLEEERANTWPLLPAALAAHAQQLHHLGGELRAENGFMQRMVLKDYEKKGLAAPKLDESCIASLADALQQSVSASRG